MATPTQPARADLTTPAPAGTAARNRFLAALVLFGLWIVVLVTMAVLSATRPQPRTPAAPEPAAGAPESPEEGGR